MLDWTPMHTSELFWRQNIDKFEEKDFRGGGGGACSGLLPRLLARNDMHACVHACMRACVFVCGAWGMHACACSAAWRMDRKQDPGHFPSSPPPGRLPAPPPPARTTPSHAQVLRVLLKLLEASREVGARAFRYIASCSRHGRWPRRLRQAAAAGCVPFSNVASAPGVTRPTASAVWQSGAERQRGQCILEPPANLTAW